MTYSSTKEPTKFSKSFGSELVMFFGVPSNAASQAYSIKALHKYAFVGDSISELALSKFFFTLLETLTKPNLCLML